MQGHRFPPPSATRMAFSDELRQNVHADTDYLLTVSNDTWFGTSHGPWQHMEITRMRAVEFAKPVIRATNSGASPWLSTPRVTPSRCCRSSSNRCCGLM